MSLLEKIFPGLPFNLRASVYSCSDTQGGCLDRLTAVSNNRIFMFGLISKHSGMNTGGVAVSIKRLSNYFAGQGCRVTILTASLPPEHLLFDGLDAEIIHVAVKSRSKIGLAFTLLRHVISSRPKAILSFDTRANRINSWLAVTPFIGVEIWTSLRNSITAGIDPAVAKLSSRVVSVYRKIHRNSTGVIAISQGLKDEFLQLTGVTEPGKVHVIHNAVVVAGFYELAAQPVYHPWFDNRTIPLIISVGRLSSQKDYPTLIRAFKIVRNTRDCRLLILGEGEERPVIEALISGLDLQDDVELPGFVANPLAFVSKANLFALSSVYEGFGNVIAEALALGVPVVATDCPHGPAEILDSDRYGKLVCVGDVEGLAAAMLEQLSTPVDMGELKKAGARFGVDNARKYLELMGFT